LPVTGALSQTNGDLAGSSRTQDTLSPSTSYIRNNTVIAQCDGDELMTPVAT